MRFILLSFLLLGCAQQPPDPIIYKFEVNIGTRYYKCAHFNGSTLKECRSIFNHEEIPIIYNPTNVIEIKK